MLQTFIPYMGAQKPFKWHIFPKCWQFISHTNEFRVFPRKSPPNLSFLELIRGELVLSGTCPPGNLSTQEHVYLGTCPRGTCLLAFLVVFGTVLIQTYIHSEVAKWTLNTTI